MSHKPIDRSPDLTRLRNEGYGLEIRSDYLLVKGVPYVATGRIVKYGTFVMKLILSGDATAKPDDHTTYFTGDYPCHADGTPIEAIRNESMRRELAPSVVVDHRFSAKPVPTGFYEDYYAKVTQYVTILSGYAAEIEPGATAKTFRPILPDDIEGASVFKYLDTASSRAEIASVTAKLAAVEKVAIVGLGGTGSYVLDILAKTPVAEIHLFDGDTFFQHNAFRAPGAPSIEKLNAQPSKAAYFKSIYEKMRNGIFAHETYIGPENVDNLREMSFVFLCLEGPAKKLIVERLEDFGVAFIDTGMGVYLSGGSLGGILRITTSTPDQRDHVRKRIPFSGDGDRNEYDANIQIADLNALSAALAVIKWKKLVCFYQDLDQEHHSTYTIGGNMLLNDVYPDDSKLTQAV